jgi:hypothetical protein
MKRDPTGPQSSPHLLYPVVPNFQKMRPEEFIDETEFHRRTELQMSRMLVMDYSAAQDGSYTENRNPAQFQPPTTEYRLFPKELAAMEQIWNREFFGNDGLTIIYREATDYLDDTVPLRIFTDMSHYVRLSRCSLVVNRSIDPVQIAETEKQISAALSKISKNGKLDPSTERELKAAFKKDRFGMAGLISFYRTSGVRRGSERQLQELLGIKP